MKPTKRHFLIVVAVLFVLRIILGIYHIVSLPPVSIDDYFRVFHAQWWWDHMSFSTSYDWLPGYGYFYGLTVGLSKDMYWAPRIATFMLHLGTGMLIAGFSELSRTSRLLALSWFLFSPLSLVLGVVPLSETLTFFCLVLHLKMFFLAKQKTRSYHLFFSSFALFAACTIRYEMWILIIPYVVTSRRLTADKLNISKITKNVIVAMPLFFPIIWILHGTSNADGAFAFLWAIHRDHLGPGSAGEVLMSPLGIVSSLQIIWLLVGMKRQLFGPLRSLAGMYFVCSFLFLLLSLFFDILPSQFGPRVFFGAVILGGLCDVKLMGTLKHFRWNVVAVVGVSCMFVGVLAISGVQRGIADENYVLSEWIQSNYRSGLLDNKSHVLISKYLPDSTAIWVLSNRIENVHIDAMERACAIQFLSPYQPTCDLPGWGQSVQVVIIRKNSFEHNYFDTFGWPVDHRTENWIVYQRPDDAPFPILNKPLHPLLRIPVND